MNYYLLVAGCITFVVGLIHSILGEVLIFQKLRTNGIIPTKGGAILKEHNVRILWASWHLVTIFGVGLGVVMIILAQSLARDTLRYYLENTLCSSMLLGAMLVFVATRARHPGWLGLMIVAVFVCIGQGIIF